MLLVTYQGSLGIKCLTALGKEGSLSLRRKECHTLRGVPAQGESHLACSPVAMYRRTPVRLIQRSVVLQCGLYLFLDKWILEKPHSIHVLIAQWVFQAHVDALCFSVGVLEELLAWLWLKHLPPLEPVPKYCWFG